MYCYRVLDGTELLSQLSGDYRDLKSGELVQQARQIAATLGASPNNMSPETGDA